MAKRMFGQYATYSFRDKDPCIDALRTIISDEKLTYKELHERTGVSVSTLWHWFEGDTKRPQHATFMAVLRGAGWDYELVKLTKKLRRVA
jgi:transcriptional regulator with XRE-family HTH domain